MIKVWAKSCSYPYSEIEVVNDKDHKRILREQAQELIDSWGDFCDWLEERYSVDDIWNMTPDDKENVWDEWIEHCRDYIEEADEYTLFELEE